MMLNEMYNPKTYTGIEELVDTIDEELLSPCEYFIAGGAPALMDLKSTVNKSEINDIDIFFKSKKHLNKFKNNLRDISRDDVTVNAENIYLSDIRIQLITMKYGSPEEILETFDLNKSKIGITSKKETIKHKSYKEPLQIDYKNFRSSTPGRYFKYVDRGFQTPDVLGTLERMLRYVSLNEIISPYSTKETDKKIVLKQMLSGFLGRGKVQQGVNLGEFMRSFDAALHEIIPTSESRIDFWEGIYNIKFFKNEFFTDEVGLGIIRRYGGSPRTSPLIEKDITDENLNILREKYPEEFI